MAEVRLRAVTIRLKRHDGAILAGYLLRFTGRVLDHIGLFILHDGAGGDLQISPRLTWLSRKLDHRDVEFVVRINELRALMLFSVVDRSVLSDLIAEDRDHGVAGAALADAMFVRQHSIAVDEEARA